MPDERIRPGDWIRFQEGTTLVVGVVAYTQVRDSYPYGMEAVTDIGSVPLARVLEVRRA